MSKKHAFACVCVFTRPHWLQQSKMKQLDRVDYGHLHISMAEKRHSMLHLDTKAFVFYKEQKYEQTGTRNVAGCA